MPLDDRSIGIVGPSIATDGQPVAQRMSRDGCSISQTGHAHYQEAVLRGNVFIAANQGMIALTSAGLGTGVITGFILYNPIASGKNAVIWNIAASVVGNPVAASLSVFGIIAGTTTGIAAPTGTTTLPIKNAIIAPATTNFCIAYSTATFAANPGFVFFIQGYVVSTAASNSATVPIIDFIEGGIIIPPGQYIAIANNATAGTQGLMCSVQWEEIPTS